MSYRPENDSHGPRYWLNIGNTTRGDLVNLGIGMGIATLGIVGMQVEIVNPSYVEEFSEDMVMAVPFSMALLGGALALASGVSIINRSVRGFVNFLTSRRNTTTDLSL